MLEEEFVISFFMALKIDRDITSQIWAICDCIFLIIGRGEHRHASTVRGWVQVNTVWAATQVGGLKDESLWLLLRRVDEGEGEVVKVAQVDVGHVDIDVVGAHRLFKVFSVQRLELRVWSQGVVSLIVDGEGVCRCKRDKIASHSIVLIFKHELLWVLFLLRVEVHASVLVADRHSSRDNKAASGAGVVPREAEGAEQRGRSSAIRIRPIAGHGGARNRKEGGMRKGSCSRGSRASGGEQRKLTRALEVT
jgi:hypothetical protein